MEEIEYKPYEVRDIIGIEGYTPGNKAPFEPSLRDNG